MSKPRVYRVFLSKKERHVIRHLQKKTSSSNARTRYAIILAADEAKSKTIPTYQEIGVQAGASVPTVIDTLRRYTADGIVKAIKPERSPNSDNARRKATGDVEARIVAKACSAPPEGYARWTLTLLAKESAVILEDSLSRATIGRILQRNDLKPHLSAYWCIPPEEDADFVANMEDVLDVYQRPYDPKHPVWCMDEKPYQILDERREPIRMKPGQIEKVDYQYVRNGVAAIFCFIEPHTGRIAHSVEETRTAVDWAEKIKYLVDVLAPDAEKITLVMDNLNTHTASSLYKAFPPAEAHRIKQKLEIHYTPKHGSWLDMAEIGIHIMTRECLDRRIPSIEALRSELKAWNEAYDKDPTPVNWQFTTNESRIKLKRLYPDIDKCRKERDERRKAKQEQQEVEEE